MKKQEVLDIVKEFKKLKTRKEIFEILEKNGKLFIYAGTPGYYDSFYIMLDPKTKKSSPVYIYDYFKDAKEMDSCVVYKSNK